MAPTVMPADEVAITAAAAPCSGDAVLFRGSGDFEVVHRYLFKVPFAPYFVHRGDAPSARVGVARCERIIGTARLPHRRPSAREYGAGVWAVVRVAWRAALRCAA